jgi:hypothetical protein
MVRRLIMKGSRSYSFVIFLILLLVAHGCGSDDATKPEDTTTSPVSETVPPDGATDIPLDVVITATFVEDIDPSSITDTTFTLSYNPLVPATVLYDSRTKTATLIPDDSLEYETTYTVTITAEKQGTQGLMSSDPILYSWTFKTIPFGPSVADLPRTGQTLIYAAGDDGAIKAGVVWPTPRFINNMDGTITDNLTGLMWLKDANCLGFKSWQYGAFHIIDSLNSSPESWNCQEYTAEYTDWRLPNINELESLISAGQHNSATWLNGQGFVNVQSLYYWSSTIFAHNLSYARCVHMWAGYVDRQEKYGSGRLWAVRGETTGPARVWKTGQTTSYRSRDDGELQTGADWPSPRFFLHLNNTVLDLVSGLTWTRGADTPTHGTCIGGMMTWQEALDYVACLNEHAFNGCSDWRLPNRKELYSLIDHSQYNPALPSDHPFMDVQLAKYWTSTTYAFETNRAWIVWIQYGDVSPWDKTSIAYVWPVRGGL